MNHILNRLQKELDKEYEREGLTSEILEAQEFINKHREFYNLDNGEYKQ